MINFLVIYIFLPDESIFAIAKLKILFCVEFEIRKDNDRPVARYTRA